jgi:hypothetical protein
MSIHFVLKADILIYFLLDYSDDILEDSFFENKKSHLC